MATSIKTLVHPDYNASEMAKHRLTYEGGDTFKEEYLAKFSAREDATEFSDRKQMSYVPAHAKAAINDIKNAIYQRMVDISRSGGTEQYQQAVIGREGGVDNGGNGMSSFIGRIALPELLSMGRVGVYVDRQEVLGDSLLDFKNKDPYIYKYNIEDIRSWTFDTNNILTSVLLRDNAYTVDDDTGYKVPSDTTVTYRYLELTNEGVIVKITDENDEILQSALLNLVRIPFVMMDIGTSLLKDIADYQIALLNLASSDVNYGFKGNYPFYVEQFSPHTAMLSRTSEDGTSADAASDREIKAGISKGRAYPVGTDQPAFIHPSPEPLDISMQKQEQMKQEIRQLVNLNITNVEPRRASAEAKSFDERGLEAGLSFIGLELEYGENLIAQTWMDYVNKGEMKNITVSYPKRYSLKTETETQEESSVILETAAKIPSNTYKRQAALKVIDLTMGTSVDAKTLEVMKEEILDAKFVLTDRETLDQDIENALVSAETASLACGYPKGEVDKAQEERAVRAAAVAEAQSTASGKGVLEIENAFKKGNDNKGVDTNAGA